MTDAWPAVTQYALEGTLSEAAEDNSVAEFKPDMGPRVLRRRTSVDTDVLAFDQLLTFVEFDLLKTFYSDTLKDGSLPFTRYHPRDIDGTTYTWQFIEPPKLKTSAYRYATVSMILRRLP